MFKNLKETIKDTAFSAVKNAEAVLTTASGKQKKEMAIRFVVSKLPIMQPFKSILVLCLSKFIDNAIEQAVICMKNSKK